MLSLFLGLQIANHAVLLIVFTVGLWFGVLFDEGAGGYGGLYPFHVGLGIAAGLLCTAANLGVYTYFMATHKWLWAASEKAGVALGTYVEPAQRNKSRAFPATMGPIVATMLAMFAGAAADRTLAAWWPGEVHLGVAAAAVAVNLLGALRQFHLIRSQQRLMDAALALFNPDASPASPA